MERTGETDGQGEVRRIGEAAEKGGTDRNEEPHLYEIIEWRQIKAEGCAVSAFFNPQITQISQKACFV